MQATGILSISPGIHQIRYAAVECQEEALGIGREACEQVSVSKFVKSEIGNFSVDLLF